MQSLLLCVNAVTQTLARTKQAAWRSLKKVTLESNKRIYPGRKVLEKFVISVNSSQQWSCPTHV